MILDTIVVYEENVVFAGFHRIMMVLRGRLVFICEFIFVKVILGGLGIDGSLMEYLRSTLIFLCVCMIQ